jgi:hypothetical protein
VPEGLYEARSVTVRRRTAYKRSYIEARFQLFDGPAEHGTILATGVPGFFPIRGAVLAPSSNLARWVQLLNPAGRRDRLPLRILERKLWRVQVVDVLTSHERGRNGKPKPLPDALRYSKVAAVLERLA